MYSVFVVCPSKLCSLSLYLAVSLAAYCHTRWPSKHSRIPPVIPSFFCGSQITQLHLLSTWWQCLSTVLLVFFSLPAGSGALRDRLVGGSLYLMFSFQFASKREFRGWCVCLCACVEVLVCSLVQCVFVFFEFFSFYNEYIFSFRESEQ